MSWNETVLALLRVPPEPEPPPGSPPRVFRAAPNYYRLLLIRWGLMQLVAIVGLTVAITAAGFATDQMPRPLVYVIWLGEVFGIATVVLNALFGWVFVRFDFELRWYMLSDRAIRIREGIVTVREKTVALANIQNISVRQGPLQRLLSIADVEVRTAGGGGETSTEGSHGKSHAEPMHVAYFRGVDNAEEIRDLLLAGVRRQRDAGLGDSDETAPDDDLRDAIAELLAAARGLRGVRPQYEI